MGKLIERGIFTSELVIGMRRVGEDAFVALVSSDRTGTKPLVVVRQRSVSLEQLSTYQQERLGCWTELSAGAPYSFAEKAPVTVYGGESPFSLTPHYMLTGTEDVRDIDEALGRMMNRAVGFARAITGAT